MADEPRRARRDGWRKYYADRRFAILLGIVVVLTVSPPVLLEFGHSSAWFDGLMTLLMLAVVQSLCMDRRQRLFALTMGLPTVLFSLSAHALSGAAREWVFFCGHLAEIGFLFGAAALIVRSLFDSRRLHFDSIFGAVCGYLFLGLAWAVFYMMLENAQPGAFEVGPSRGTSSHTLHELPQLLTYYSFVTLTTVGYGDITPISPIARTSAWVEAITGQFYLAVIVAGLVSVLVANTRRPKHRPTAGEDEDAE